MTNDSSTMYSGVFPGADTGPEPVLVLLTEADSEHKGTHNLAIVGVTTLRNEYYALVKL